MYDGNHRLTRAGMEQVIADGGSVNYKGRVIASVAGLPTAEDLAESETERKAAGDDLDAQIAALTARKAKLDAKPIKPAVADSDEHAPHGKGAKK